MTTLDPEEILKRARRRVGISERRRYLLLFLGIGMITIQAGVIVIIGEEPEAFFQFSESFVCCIGLGFLVSFLLASGIPCIAVHLYNYNYLYSISKRLIDFEDDKLKRIMGYTIAGSPEIPYRDDLHRQTKSFQEHIEAGRKERAFSQESILEKARRHVTFIEHTHCHALACGILWLVSSIVYLAVIAIYLEDFFQSVESFVWGFLLGVLLVMQFIPGTMCVALFLRKYGYEYNISKRIIELEEERLRESKR